MELLHFGDKNFILGEAKYLGGGSSLNTGLIWRTPDFIIESWKKITINIFNNFDVF